MIIHRAFYKEAAITTMVVMFVLALLVVSQKAVFMLSGAALGDIKATWVATLLLLDLFRDFDLLMQLALFVGILVTLNRWYRDSEMVVMNACGIGFFDLLRPVMVFTLVVAAVVSVVVMVIRPAAFNRIQEVQQENADKADLGILLPGRFSSVDGYTYFVEAAGPGGGRRGIFVHRVDRDQSQTIVAEQARQHTDRRTGFKTLILQSGSVYQGQPGFREYQVTRFDEYRIELPPGGDYRSRDEVEGVPMSRLTMYPDRVRGLVELQTRLGKPAMLFVFAAIAMLLSYTRPRSSHYLSLFVAVLVFFLYLTILQYVRDQMKSGQVSPVYSLWLVHLAVATVTGFFMLRRSKGLPLLQWRLPGRGQ